MVYNDYDSYDFYDKLVNVICSAVLGAVSISFYFGHDKIKLQYLKLHIKEAN